MPYQLAHHDQDNQVFFIGRCPTLTAGTARYVIISVRGLFTLNEVQPFLALSRARGAVPFFGPFFANQVYIDSRFMAVVLPLECENIKYYVDKYAIPQLISQYEWNLCRHAVHQFAAPSNRTRRVFGDYMTPAEQAQAVRERDLQHVFRVATPA